MCSAFGAIPWADLYYEIEQNFPIYICQVYDEYATKMFIAKIFKQLNLGDVEFVYFQHRLDGIGQQAIIHVRWYYNKSVENLQDKIKNLEKEARLVYDDPNYWILKKYVLNQSQQNDRLEMLEERLYKLEGISSSMQWNIKLHDANIEYFAKKINQNADGVKYSTSGLPTICQNSDNNTTQLYQNNSCCGAASDAWVPSYPSQSTNIY